MNEIIIKNAREHNLANINVKIPRDKLVVISGVSGSGKSSLAFDTIFAEGERRYLESLSSYARQFLGQMKKPNVDHIEGLSPAISIQQQGVHGNPRSIVGTVTEIYDYFRLLWARVGTPFCPVCGKELKKTTIDEIIEKVLRIPEGTKILILSPQVNAKKGTFTDLFENLQDDGFVRVMVDKQMKTLDDSLNLEKNKKHTIDIVVDRIKVRLSDKERIADSLEIALRYGKGVVKIQNLDEDIEKIYSEQYFCMDHEIGIGEIDPKMFSFNSPTGACEHCDGLGEMMIFDPALLLDEDKSLNEGALLSHPPTKKIWFSYLKALAKELSFSLDESFQKLPKKAQKAILYGYEKKLKVNYHSGKISIDEAYYEGVIPQLNRWYFDGKKTEVKEWLEQFTVFKKCTFCDGKRLQPLSLSIKIEGKNIIDVTQMNIKDALCFFENAKENLSKEKMQIADSILREIFKRLQFILDVGLDYLTLFRKAGTLSGGEFQRIRLATQIGSGLTGVLYVLDEPTIGLHPRDTNRLIQTLLKLRNMGNTVLIVEHDEDIINSADYIVDIGPGAGAHGGKVVFAGKVEDLKKDENSLTGLYLSGKKTIPLPKKQRIGNGLFLKLFKVAENNLKKMNVSFPLGKLIAVTGVSGSGKSTLVNQILYPILTNHFYHSRKKTGAYQKIEGLENIDKVINIDQSPIGRTPRSNPATYTGLFGIIRDLFASLPDAKARAYKPGRFSFNVKGGRCEHCQGDGVIKVEMHFLPDIFLECEVCKGKRYNNETLQVLYKGKSIADVLSMTVEEALLFFENIPGAKRRLQILQDVGLGYIKLGQNASTLSGGEAQRIKLAKELSKIGSGNTFYILDEPTVGLHFADVDKLIRILQFLVDKGNTVLVIEHNQDVIKVADHLIDLGPDGGEKGGKVIFSGTPCEIIKEKDNLTGKFLKRYLENIHQNFDK